VTKDDARDTAPRPFIFVLMPFSKQFDDVFELGIRPAAEAVGAYAERADGQSYAGSVVDRIHNQINKSDVIVADLTGGNPNVFYEVGYAHALNKLVILLAGDAAAVPFNLAGFRHVRYAGADAVKQLLQTELRWAIGEAGRRVAPAPRGRLKFECGGQDVPEASSSAPGPIIPVFAQDAESALLRLTIRNAGRGMTREISHIYGFTGHASPIAFARLIRTTNTLAFGNRTETHEQTDVQPLPSVASDQDMASAGLALQYKLDAKAPPIPERGAESVEVPLWFERVPPAGPWPLLLRLHDGVAWVDFRFLALLHFEKG
jgi:hypothetical protein